jgi:hypothetical protein
MDFYCVKKITAHAGFSANSATESPNLKQNGGFELPPQVDPIRRERVRKTKTALCERVLLRPVASAILTYSIKLFRLLRKDAAYGAAAILQQNVDYSSKMRL